MSNVHKINQQQPESQVSLATITAHDVNRHYGYFSPVHRGWVIRNLNTEYSTYVAKTYPNIVAMLSALERFSGRQADTFSFTL